MSYIKFAKLNEDAVIPAQATEGSAGLDLSFVWHEHCGDAGKVILHTGLAVQPPAGHYFELHARSSLHKSGWTLANSVGIIDEDYRGEILIVLSPLAYVPSIPKDGSRVAQLILRKSLTNLFNVAEVDEKDLDTTERGSGGFGSTG